MRAAILLFVILATATMGSDCSGGGAETLDLPGLGAPVRVFTDEIGVRHIYAEDDLDLARAQGWVMARDRMFKMDYIRQTFAGTSAELSGRFPDLVRDALIRPVDVPAMARRSEQLLEPRERAILQAFADGINHWLATSPLPPEYANVGVTTVAPWEVTDTLMLMLGIDLDGADIELSGTDELDAAIALLGPEAGWAFYNEDIAPHVATVPDALGALPLAKRDGAPSLHGQPRPHRPIPTSSLPLLTRQGDLRASNAWAIAGWASETGAPIVAADGHNPLDPATGWYEVHLVVEDDPVAGPMDVNGYSIGAPGVHEAGQNPHLAWAITATLVDDRDFFRDTLVRDDPGCPTRLCIVSEGDLHPVLEGSETYRLNVNGVAVAEPYTSLITALFPTSVSTLTVPFRGAGPIARVADIGVVDGSSSATQTEVLTFQSVTSHGDRFFAKRWRRLRARDVFEFRETLPGAEHLNWVVADVEGNVGFFTTGRVPLRRDLESGYVHEAVPWVARDGSGPANWIPRADAPPGEPPYELLPFEELPQVINPPSGFVANSNEDPSGTWLDNDPLNEARVSNPEAIYYLGAIGNAGGDMRGFRVRDLITETIERDGKLGVDDMMRIQIDSQMRDAEILRPYLLSAFARATSADAPAELSALVDPATSEAVARIEAWGLSTPTGIPEGYDNSDEDGVRDPLVTQEEIAESVGATLHNLWRAKLVENVMSARIAALGLPEVWQLGSFVGLIRLLRAEPFTGVGASGVDFFPSPATLTPEDRRDLALLQALRDALDELASPALDRAYGGSTDQQSYRWGLLARTRLLSVGGLAVPNGGGFTDVGPRLPGLAREGAFDTVSSTGFHPSCYTGDYPKCVPIERFVSSWGSVYRRVVALPTEGEPVRMWTAFPGGASADPSDPLYVSRLGKYLTGDYDELPLEIEEIRAGAQRIEKLVPPVAP